MKFEKDIILSLSDKIFDELKECNRKVAPIEACGLIFGRVEKVAITSDDFKIRYVGEQFYCLKSNIESMGSFALIKDSDTYFEIHQEAVNEKKLRLISIFHSHPVPAYPSATDVQNMELLDKDVGGVRNPFKNQIWTIMDMNAEDINGFIYFNNELMQVDIQILEK
jgi:proteasome lid subunit RPN8/RPN11